MVIFLNFAFVVIGGLACVLAFWLQYMNCKAASWPAADGVIIKSELDDLDGDASVRITYRYTVNGRNFESSQFSFTAVANDLPAKKRRVAQYPVGQRVPVYYDPQNPTTAVLERGAVGILATGLIFIVAALMLL